MAIQSVKTTFAGKEYTLETGRFAKFANGSVMVSSGDTMVLVTVVASEKELEGIDFLPLQVEYREKIAAAGKIPGGFTRREGKPSDREVLCARLIDRPIRPMIPKTWHHETQIVANVFSADPEVDPDTLAAVGASAALMISNIPFNGPISEVRIARHNGELIINPSNELLKECDIDITVGGTDTAITMVEGESKEISEADFVEALVFAHEKIKELNKLQKELASMVEVTKRPIVEDLPPDEFKELIVNTIESELNEFVHTITTKEERRATRHAIHQKALDAANEKYAEDETLKEKIEKYTGEIVDKLEKKLMREMILAENKRLDGRTTTDIRPITCEVGLLPRAHGSALFTRGETQSLTTATLGTSRDEQMIDGLNPVRTERFILHYNFPPFSTGETGRMMTSRREIGHGHLAWRALKEVLPNSDAFPYTIRIVSDILESNGSSSMATVCAGSLAMFDAGLPVRKAVAGIAMGLIKEDDRVAILSDILGDEDFLGDMDFKVAGTVDGITACQMDIKIEGLSVEIMTRALEQARAGRMHILNIMNQSLQAPREDLSAHAPRYTLIKIPQEMIGAVIGPGGETIRSIIKETGTEINIEDDGTVQIASTNKTAGDEAAKIIGMITRKPSEGEVYKGTVKEIREGLGALVEFLPKTQGLLHISQISNERIKNVADVLKVGDKIDVKLLEISRDGKYRLSMRALLPGYEEQANERQPRENSERRESSDRRPHPNRK